MPPSAQLAQDEGVPGSTIVDDSYAAGCGLCLTGAAHPAGFSA